MTTSITDAHRKTVVTEVRDIIITETVDDGGTFVRSIRILGDIGGDDPAEVMEIVVSSATKTDIDVTAPGYEF